MKRLRPLLATVLVLGLGIGYVHGTQMLKRNLGDLVRLSEFILVGKILSVTDGLQNDVPYTEITIEVSKNVLGDINGTYTFRQFGLLQPRDMENGLVNLNVSPDGWPKFAQGEQVMVFLYKAGDITGFRTTVGLFQGKFSIVEGKISNAIENLGLFQNLALGPRQLTTKEQSLLQSKKGPMRAETFIDFVTKAVTEGWFR